MRKPMPTISASEKVVVGVCTHEKGAGPCRRMPLRAMMYWRVEGEEANIVIGGR